MKVSEYRSIGVSEKNLKKMVTSYKELRVYQNAFEGAMQVFETSESFPRKETFSLTDQIRRSSRSVCANIAEAWRKRRYPAAFVAKLSDAESEAAETQVWIQFAERCRYISGEQADDLDRRYEHILAQLVLMIEQPERWIIRR